MKKRYKVLIGIWIGIILLNLLAWCSAPFCDWYVTYVFPIGVHTYGRLSGVVSFSVGEWMLYLSVVYMLVNLILCIPAWILRKRECGKKLRRFLSVVPWFVTLVCIIMTLNCTILYHCTPMKKLLLQEVADAGENDSADSLERLIALREEVVANCNRLAGQMQRDENGYIVAGSHKELSDRAIRAMQGISEQFPRLSGYYPDPKPLMASWFFSQQYMCGYYFPFSMEANYNDMMYVMNIPYTLCHELSHLKGYIYEDEANFLAYLACLQSGNQVFEYSGYLGVLYYVENDLHKALESSGQLDYYEQLTPIDAQVHTDNCFLTPEAWSKVEDTSFLDTEFVAQVSDEFVETTLTLNGVEDGMISYSRVVELLLLYKEIQSTQHAG